MDEIGEMIEGYVDDNDEITIGVNTLTNKWYAGTTIYERLYLDKHEHEGCGEGDTMVNALIDLIEKEKIAND